MFDSDDLPKYTPYARASYPAGTGITLCNVTPKGSSTDRSETNTTSPRLRVARGAWTEGRAGAAAVSVDERVRPRRYRREPSDATDKVDEFTVRVKACDSTLIGSGPCKSYGTTPSWKPIGLLQEYADADKLAIRFGLMTGSYGKRKSGGVLRKNVARLTDEISAATARSPTSTASSSRST